MVIDYSKWDHIDTGSSEEDEEPNPKPAEAVGEQRCSEQAKEEEPKQKPEPKTAEGVGEGRFGQVKEEKTVQCIRVHCDGEPGHWETLQLPVSHPILSAPISSVSQRIGLPLHVYLEKPLPNPISHPNRAHYDNQLITYLMIDPVSGFAPPLYQAGVGTALVCRSDLKPLSVHHLEAVWMFCSHLLDMFGDGPDAVLPDRDITRPKFERFFLQYKDEKAGIASSYRDIGYPNQDAENWQPIGSPFDV